MLLKAQLTTTNGQPQPPNNQLQQMNKQNQLTTKYTMDWEWIQNMLKISKNIPNVQHSQVLTGKSTADKQTKQQLKFPLAFVITILKCPYFCFL